MGDTEQSDEEKERKSVMYSNNSTTDTSPPPLELAEKDRYNLYLASISTDFECLM